AGSRERSAAVLDRLAPRGHALVRRLLGIARNYPHPVERQVELFCGDLCQGSDDALAEFDLAGEDRCVPVAADADPGVENAVVVEAAGKPRGLLRTRNPRREREGERDAAEPGNEIAP